MLVECYMYWFVVARVGISNVRASCGSLLCVPQIRFYFFFSSRRRHTRSLCDWSSDVCSSDLCDHREGARGWNSGPRLDHHDGAVEQLDAAGRPESRVQPAWTEQDGIRKLAGSEVRRGTARERELGRELVLRPRPSRRSRLHRRDVPLGGAKLLH